MDSREHAHNFKKKTVVSKLSIKIKIRLHCHVISIRASN
jgi:hypothetical protein